MVMEMESYFLLADTTTKHPSKNPQKTHKKPTKNPQKTLKKL
jgi:hypothetical protein